MYVRVYNYFMLEKIISFVKKILIKIYEVLKKILIIIMNFFKAIFCDNNKEEKPDGFWDTVKSLLIALILALLIRSFLYEPFHIPSGSMKPGLKEGDFIFVSKYDFGYSRYSFPLGLPIFNGRIFFNKKPARGDVLVFRLPSDPSINYIKKLIGLPGDKIQMKDGILYVNDNPVQKIYLEDVLENDDDKDSITKEYREILDNGKEVIVLDKVENGPGDNTPIFIVPENYYFFMGDNRDNSLDSRFSQTGFVPEENLIGKARIIFFSSSENPLKFWKWNKIIRTDRIFKKIE